MTSWALWIPLLWIVIIGSRAISLWFGGGIQIDTPDDYLAGSPLDRNVFTLLIVFGLGVLLIRRVNWSEVFASNRLIFVFFLYCLVSILWSDYAWVGFKRWIKDLGNVVMVLVIFTENDPVNALKAVLSRYTYIAIPLSITFNKYFPEIGRYYNRWTWEPAFCGIATEKNALGSIILICGLFLVWEIFGKKSGSKGETDKADFIARIVLMLMVLYLIISANSQTAFVSLVLGAGTFLYMQLPIAKRQIRHLGAFIIIVGIIFGMLYFVLGTNDRFITELVGRDATLTGRTNLWSDLISEPINPFIGTGYQSFWLGPRAELYWVKYSFHPNQAHNGYLETYLNGGFIGLFLLISVLVQAGNNLRKKVLLQKSYGIFFMAFFFVMIIYNWTEAIFNKMGLTWFVLLIGILNYPGSPLSVNEKIKTRDKNIG